MRVLIPQLFPLHLSGSGAYVKALAEGLLARGHEVLLLAPPDEHPAPVFLPMYLVPFRCAREGMLELTLDNPESLAAHKRHYGQLDDAQLDAYLRLWDEAIGAAIRHFSPDLVHAQHAWVSAGLAARRGLPLVITLHGTGLASFERDPRCAALAREGARGARRIIAISRYTAELGARALDLPEGRIALVPHGYDARLFGPEGPRAPLPRDLAGGPIVGFAGRLVDDKGADVLLAAARIYETEAPSLGTLIFGAGGREAALRSQADALGLRRVRFSGHVDQETLATFYRAADVWAVPSRREGFGLVALEALASGVPIVASRTGGLVDLVEPSHGTLVAPEDPEALAAAILAELAHPDRDARGRRAAAFAAARFSREACLDRTEALYREALGGA
ncbi:MAG: glycosyltransferase [Byssovorax sp.]